MRGVLDAHPRFMDNDENSTQRLRAANRRVLLIVGVIALLLYLSQYFIRG